MDGNQHTMSKSFLEEQREVAKKFMKSRVLHNTTTDEDLDTLVTQIITNTVEKIKKMEKPNFINKTFSSGYDRAKEDIIESLTEVKK